MLLNLASARGEAFVLTVEQVQEEHRQLDVNTAELIGLRLYTGPMFEFYNTVRARHISSTLCRGR